MPLRAKGIAVPFRFGSKGYPEPARGVEALEGWITTVLKTPVGARVHRPTFGSGLQRVLFSGVSRATAVRARVEARRALEKWVPQIIVDEITFRTEDSSIILELAWRPRNNMSDARRNSITFAGAGLR